MMQKLDIVKIHMVMIHMVLEVKIHMVLEVKIHMVLEVVMGMVLIHIMTSMFLQSMKTIYSENTVDIPKNVKIWVKSRHVTVKGPRGMLRRSFRHLAVDLKIVDGGKKLRAEMWFGDRRSKACIRTVTSHIKNMMTGVSKGFQYKMRMVYAHFPISCTIENEGKEVAIRNFLGEKHVRSVVMFDGVKVERSSDGTKDEIILSGNDINKVSQSAANVHIASRVRNKDIRKFLDGVYVSSKGKVVKDD